MKNIHILPTDKPSRISIRDIDNKLCIHRPEVVYRGINQRGINQNIYITSDEKPKAGEYAIATLNGNSEVVQLNQSTCIYYDSKIVLTTDQDLNKDGVQAIDDEFLEWFVKNPNCEEVLVIKNWNYPLDKRWEYKINFIIIKEYDPNQNALNFEIDALKRQVEVLKHQQEQFTQEGFDNITNQVKEMETEKTNDELIGSIINGSLLIDIRRILDEKVQPIKERKCYIQQKLDEANELLYKNGIKERPYRIDHRGA
jgi:hypothetical protein